MSPCTGVAKSSVAKISTERIIPERCLGILLVEMLDQLGHAFCVGLRLKDVALLHQELLDVVVVRDDPVVDDDEPV